MIKDYKDISDFQSKIIDALDLPDKKSYINLEILFQCGVFPGVNYQRWVLLDGKTADGEDRWGIQTGSMRLIDGKWFDTNRELVEA